MQVSTKIHEKGVATLSTFQVLTLLFGAGNLVIILVKHILELVKMTKNNRLKPW